MNTGLLLTLKAPDSFNSRWGSAPVQQRRSDPKVVSAVAETTIRAFAATMGTPQLEIDPSALENLAEKQLQEEEAAKMDETSIFARLSHDVKGYLFTFFDRASFQSFSRVRKEYRYLDLPNSYHMLNIFKFFLNLRDVEESEQIIGRSVDNLIKNPGEEGVPNTFMVKYFGKELQQIEGWGEVMFRGVPQYAYRMPRNPEELAQTINDVIKRYVKLMMQLPFFHQNFRLAPGLLSSEEQQLLPMVKELNATCRSAVQRLGQKKMELLNLPTASISRLVAEVRNEEESEANAALRSKRKEQITSRIYINTIVCWGAMHEERRMKAHEAFYRRISVGVIQLSSEDRGMRMQMFGGASIEIRFPAKPYSCTFTKKAEPPVAPFEYVSDDSIYE